MTSNAMTKHKEALEALDYLVSIDWDFDPDEADTFVRRHHTAIRSALQAASWQPEPSAYRVNGYFFHNLKCAEFEAARNGSAEIVPLYALPAAPVDGGE